MAVADRQWCVKREICRTEKKEGKRKIYHAEAAENAEKNNSGENILKT